MESTVQEVPSEVPCLEEDTTKPLEEEEPAAIVEAPVADAEIEGSPSRKRHQSVTEEEEDEAKRIKLEEPETEVIPLCETPSTIVEEEPNELEDASAGSLLEPKIEIEEPVEEEATDSPAEDVGADEEPASESAERPTEVVQALNIHEKLREMDEISVKPVSKTESLSNRKKDSDSEVSVEIKKKAMETEDSKRITNLRKNIREVMDENQLDAVTLAAQRQESERLARVQEQQKIIRELQRQMAAERHNNRTQNRVLSLLQGQTSLLKSSSTTSSERSSMPGSSTDMYVVKGVASEVTFKGSNFVDLEKINSGNLTPSVSIAPVRRAKSIDEDASGEEDKKEVVTIVDSSSEDDCIVLSDDDEDIEEEVEDDPHNSGLHVNDAYNIPDEQGRVVINIGHPEGEPDIFVAPQISRIIKPHQIGGVRFLFDNIIESTERFSTSSGFGCILAHSMGLGKTLQVVCFCDIFLRHTNSKSVLCIMPINTLQNWVAEFNMWLPDDPEKSPHKSHGEVRPRNFKIFVLNDQYKTLSARSKVILEWAKEGGVLLIGYELFRLLALKLVNKKKKGKKAVPEKVGKTETEAHKKLMEDIHSALVRPGPDLVICDEGHRIKNSHASISVALKQIRSKRRIVLTGYPLQNNLLEYWCMVDFVRPNYLGTRTEFSNMFERPIQNGQCIDSTPQDIKLMRYRAHVLHSLLVGFVQRRSHVVLQNSLPQKEEYVILVRMTQFQRKLYDVFMNEVVRIKAVPNPLKAFAVCCKIWNHPDVLYNFLKKREADLDIELEEPEPEPGTAPGTGTGTGTGTTQANAKGKKKASPKNGKEINKDGKTIPAVEVSPNRSKEVSETGTSPDQKRPIPIAPKEEPARILEPPTPLSQSQSTSSSFDSNFSQYNSYNCDGYYGQYNNLYSQDSYSNQSYDASFMSQNQGNYWQGNQNYFDYNNGQDPYGPVDPTYTGMIPKATESFDHPKLPSEEKNSSEIVDLDTKEIKTVETSISALDLQDLKLNSPPKKSEPVDEPSTPGVEKEVVKIKEDGIPYEWALELMKGYVPDLLENSPKMVIFFRLLEESLKLGDRILVFSQSLLTLNLIERFLQNSNVPGFDYKWAKNSTYFRLDGSTTAIEREKLVNEFNANPQIHLFLVSTRAGSLGINLVGANRVIVFDASWNPCHDTQAVCRVYRYGQKKPCFVYRIVMDNCLEKKIYDRQVNKQGMSDRVVDECNPDAHLSLKEVTNLCYDNEEETEVKDFSEDKEKYLDIVMQKIVEMHSPLLSKEPFHHESLLVDRKEKKLSQAEKRLAQRGYEMEKRAAAKPAYMYHPVGTQYRVMRTPDGSLVHRPVASVRPMQADTGERSHITRPGGVRPTRWIPAEVWQRQGMTAQEMTLPLDVVIPTSSGDKANIVLKAGQKVMVLKSPKGIYMQLESGKIIAIRTSFKMGQNKEKIEEPDIGLSKVEEHIKGQKNDINFEATPRAKGASMFNIKHKQSEPISDLFKSNTQPRGSSAHSAAPLSKSFNVQHLIDNKTSSTFRQSKDASNSDDVIMVQDNAPETFNARSGNSHSKNPFHRNSFGYNQNSRQPTSFQSSSNSSPMANIKPQFHENKSWDQQKSKVPPTQTITIDDDVEPTVREKPIYKPNLVERKHKTQPPKNIPNFQQNPPQNPKPNPITFSKGKQEQQKGTNSPESFRQMQNVRPYNRQFSEHKLGSAETPPRSVGRPKIEPTPVKSEMRPKMPNIKNIPAPYPSACASQAQPNNSTATSTRNTSSYPQSAHTAVSSDVQQDTPPSETSVPPAAPPQKMDTSADAKDSDTTNSSRDDSGVSAQSQDGNQSSNHAEKVPTEENSYNRYDQATASYGAPQSDPSYSYMASDPNYSQQYPNMYAPPNTHPYNYSQHFPNSQQGYPYGSYHNQYDPNVYSGAPPSSTPNYPAHGSSMSMTQSGQYNNYYSNYPPRPPHPPQTTDQYNPYYNYPPYPPPASQWPQQ